MSIINNPDLMELVVSLIIKSLLILVIILTATLFARRESAAVRHLFLSTAIIILLVLPIYALFIPSWNLDVFSNPIYRSYQTSSISQERIIEEDQKSENLSNMDELRSLNDGEIELKSKTALRIYDRIFLIWIIGTVVFLLGLIGGRLYSYLLFSKSPKLKDLNLIDKINKAKQVMRLNKDIEVLQSDRVKVPVITGLFKSKLILPETISQWNEDRFGAVLYHELSHIKRNDILLQFLGQLTCTLYWFNPLTWIIERNLLLERERACDNVVLQLKVKPSEYAEYLMETSEELGTTHRKKWSFTGMAEGTDFKDRILSILDPNARRTHKKLHSFMKTMILILILVPVLAFSPWPRNANTILGVKSIEGENYSFSESDLVFQKDQNENIKPGIQDPKFEQLLITLQTGSGSEREHAATALGKLGNVAAVGPLIKVLENDENPRVREHIVTALGELGDIQAFNALLNSLKNDNNARVQQHAVVALGKLRDNRAYSPILQTIEDSKDEILRAEAIAAIGYLPDKRVLAILYKYLDDKNANFRLHAVHGLMYQGMKESITKLKLMLKDPDENVRRAAAMAIDEISASE